MKTGLSGDAVMLSRYGEIYDAIDKLYHPNPGLKEDEYPEIERCVDWLYLHELDSEDTYEWIKIRVAREFSEENYDLNEIILNTMFCDTYSPCERTISEIKRAVKELHHNLSEVDDYSNRDEIVPAEKIASFINEKFLRVRCGGKLNPEDTDSIYFRISSHGYDWHRCIVEFLWDVFESPKKMPRTIWIGHDAETNPPEITLFEGTPEELFEDFDSKIFESFIKENNCFPNNKNKDRQSFYLNKKFCGMVKEYNKSYISYC